MSRRQLDWRTLDDVVADVRTLHDHGCERSGNWDLTQTLQHLTRALIGSIQGEINGNQFRAPAPVRAMIRITRIKQRVFRTRKLASGVPAPKFMTEPDLDPCDQAQAVQRFADAVTRYRDHTGPLAMHPIFGDLTRDEWDEFHVIHAMHHLGRLWPK